MLPSLPFPVSGGSRPFPSVCLSSVSIMRTLVGFGVHLDNTGGSYLEICNHITKILFLHKFTLQAPGCGYTLLGPPIQPIIYSKTKFFFNKH